MMPWTLLSRFIFYGSLILAISAWRTSPTNASVLEMEQAATSATVMFYMNGDNDLTDEVLSAVDRIETVGSSDTLNIIALVDGHPNGVARFGKQWIGTHLLHILSDDQIGQINSKVLADWGEQDLGDPRMLSRFIQEAVNYFPSDRYIFCAFAHGKGVIDTGNLTGNPAVKSLSISPDVTSQTIMSLPAFKNALEKGLNGQRFSLMVLFSCLSSMVEIGYALSDVTDYLIASEDEIRLINEPLGTHQLGGIDFKDLLQHLKINPALTDVELGRLIVNRFIAPYTREVCIIKPDGSKMFCRYPAGLALVDCRLVGTLAAALDKLAATLIEDLSHPNTVLQTLTDLQTVLRNTQKFKSFLNLEYYDLLDWLDALYQVSTNVGVRRMCRQISGLLINDVITFERHTQDIRSNGMAIYFNHYMVPQNIYAAHQAMYRQTRFSQDTRWDELIETFRAQLLCHQWALLLNQSRIAYQHHDMELFHRLSIKIVRMLSHQIQEGRFDNAQQYIAFLDTLPAAIIPRQIIDDLKNWAALDNDSLQAQTVSHQAKELLQRTNLHKQ